MSNNTILRRCSLCSATNQEVKFYNGVTNRCADCHARKSRENRASKIDYYKAYDAKRFQENPKRKLANLAYLQTPKGKAVEAASKLKWKTLNPSKRAAHVILGNAVRDKKLTKPKVCSICATPKGRIHGHHTDYTKPLDVIWCCAACHSALHKNN